MLPEPYRHCKILFLANGSTELANEGPGPVPRRELTVADTMDHYIRDARPGLAEALCRGSTDWC